MSRRKLQWKRNAAHSGDVNKIIPVGAKGRGEYLTKHEIPGRENGTPRPGEYEGKVVTQPISPRKEKLVRQWCKS